MKWIKNIGIGAVFAFAFCYAVFLYWEEKYKIRPEPVDVTPYVDTIDSLTKTIDSLSLEVDAQRERAQHFKQQVMNNEQRYKQEAQRVDSLHYNDAVAYMRNTLDSILRHLDGEGR
jgi:hypothetical protein